MHVSDSMDLSKNPRYPTPLFNGSIKAREELFFKYIQKDAAVKFMPQNLCQ